MSHSEMIRWQIAVAFLLWPLWNNTLYGAEPVNEFLDGLRGRGYYDLALDYLGKIESDERISAEVKQTIQYEIGATLIEASRRQRDLARKSKQLDRAQESLRKFIASHGEHPMTTLANKQLGNVLLERARLNLARARESSDTPDKKLLDQSRTHFTEATAVFEKMVAELRGRLEKMPKVIDSNKESELFDLRETYRAQYVQGLMVVATVRYETAATFEPKSEERKKVLREAADAYENLYEKYRRRMAGLLALFGQGQCYQELGELDQALTAYVDIMEAEDRPEIRALKTKAMKAAIQCWMHESQGKYEAAIERGSEWVKSARPNEQRDPQWMALRLALARSLIAGADARKATKPNDPFIKRYRSDARAQAKLVARYPGPLQKEARQLLVDLGSVAANPDEKPDPKTFAEANTAGAEALEEMQSSRWLGQKLEGQLDRASDPEKRSEVEDQLADARLTADERLADAAKYFQLALQFADQDVDTDQLSAVYYYLSFIHYSKGEFYDAIVFAEYVARRNPDSTSARPAAKISLASFVQLYQSVIAEENADSEFESNHIQDIGQYIAATWRGTVEADEALITLINISIQQKQFDDAEKYLEMFDTESARRGEAELRTGQALWSKYLRDMKALSEQSGQDSPPTGDELNAEKKDLEELKTRAKKILADGIERMKEGELNTTLSSAVLALAQILLDTGEPELSKQYLEDEKIGPLRLVQDNHSVVQRPGFAEETYKTALRSYISMVPLAASASERDAIMEKAQQLMNSLEASVGDTPEGKRKLVGIYVSLARDVEKQIQLAPADMKNELSSGFETFLTRVSETTTDGRVLNWIAEMFFSLGNSNDSGEGKASEMAKHFYQRADEMYQKILDQNTGDSETLDPNLLIRVRMRMATTKRRMGRFKDAIDLFEAILKERNRMVDVQVEAAITYQEWAQANKNPDYRGAITGGRPDPKTRKNTIWGWANLSRVTGTAMTTSPKYKDTFHQARYNLALCRYRHALHKKGKDRTDYLKRAKGDITKTVVSSPDWGGPAWKSKFDSLLKQIQGSLGENPVGLEARRPKQKVSRAGS